MADNSLINWTDATWNPITGCKIVSAGCTNCYAMKLAGTRLRDHPSRTGLTIKTKGGYVWNGEVRFNPDWLTQPLKWNRSRKIFVCAHSDLFYERIPLHWIDQVVAIMVLASHHTFQVLTKRPHLMRSYFKASCWKARVLTAALRLACDHKITLPADFSIPDILPNVCLGTSVESQSHVDERLPDLIMTPAALHFISAEPLLGEIDVTPYIHAKSIKQRTWSNFKWPDKTPSDLQSMIQNRWSNANHFIRACLNRGYSPQDIARNPDGYALVTSHEGGLEYSNESSSFRAQTGCLDIVIAGGESGNKGRITNPLWIENLLNQCEQAEPKTAFDLKQWGEWAPLAAGISSHFPDGNIPKNIQWRALKDYPSGVYKVHKKIAGRSLNGVEYDAELTPSSRIRPC